jgi:hypothetical protein
MWNLLGQKTLSAAKRHNKPYLCINPGILNAETKVREFLDKLHPVVVNVEGNRESQRLGISKQVANLIERVLSEF